MDTGTDLAQRATITAMINAYRTAARDTRQAFAALAGAEKRLNEVFTLGGCGTLRLRDGTRHHHTIDFGKPGDVLRHLERDLWRTIVDRLELRRMMSIKAWTEMEKQLGRGDMPELTEANVFAMVRGFQSSMPAMIEAAVGEVFDWLRPPGSNYKTNTEMEVGRRAILGYVVETAWAGEGYRVSYDSEPRLTALENVFSALDGQGQITKSYYSGLSNAIKGSGASGRGKTAYFAFRACKNRNLHIEFLRLDLLQKFNAIAGGARLRPD